ncbi:MAG: cysteine sulfinate desulfinase [Sphingobacteriales bacterium SCN 48-20]|uniref:aminotransferase class V-fold PLP-dependent enzyme n=1 Tax=Terrimonas ferruginea TaxID=249 RepID=UPI00086E09B7|nr:cysteine desulfurase [Terrimonas ferruginea]MBN8784365.1 cysteine desulfurase [Terrimonas ferruginea]ODT92500.1 MAG: cysteine sulfinate desulfinase [Sphingobacteriales bacterium SCN 48-20]OJW45797.1 MAG: cysteine sulfinate desulfinase [Sphingobacteriales bacterium 48-107]
MITETTIPSLDIAAIRRQFPVLHREVKGHPLVYLDNAATSQKPKVVIDALVDYYSGYNANIHRGIHTLAEEATAAFEATRDTVARFINAASREQIIFTRGTTESINLVAQTWGRRQVNKGDEIIISGMEHHSNIVPWQLLCLEKEAVLKVIPVLDNGELDLDAYKALLSPRTKIVSIVHVSNALGTVNPVKEIIEAARQQGAVVMIDGAQSSVHLDIDVQALDCDFFAMSAHKVYGPTGIGILYGKKELLENMPVFQGGGEMIKEVSFEGTTFNELPYKYEAGTPNIADTIAFKAALDFVTETGKGRMRQHEDQLLAYATDKLQQLPGLRIIGQAAEKISLVSFIIDGIHPQDIGILLDTQGIAVRTGHHCAQPLMHRFGIPGTVRASFAVYNTMEELDRLIAGLQRAIKLLA